MNSLELKTYSLLKKFTFEKKPSIAVSVSGGPDSIALIYILKKWIINKQGTLIALIVDHGIRKESLLEANLVKNYLNSINITSKVLKVSQKKIMSKNMSTARSNRFEKLIKYCQKKQILHLFLGHHYDDNIETFFLRKIAGSNIEGLNSIQEKTIYNKIQIIRPLLKCTKKEIIKFNDVKKLFYINDPSNLNEKYSRVIVRKLLQNKPLYKNEVAKDFALIQKNYNNYLRMIFQIFHLTNIGIYKKVISFNCNKFFNLDIEIQTKLVEVTYKFLVPKKPFIRHRKITNMLDKLSNKSNLSFNIANINVKKTNDSLNFSLR